MLRLTGSPGLHAAGEWAVRIRRLVREWLQARDLMQASMVYNTAVRAELSETGAQEPLRYQVDGSL